MMSVNNKSRLSIEVLLWTEEFLLFNVWLLWWASAHNNRRRNVWVTTEKHRDWHIKHCCLSDALFSVFCYSSQKYEGPVRSWSDITTDLQGDDDVKFGFGCPTSCRTHIPLETMHTNSLSRSKEAFFSYVWGVCWPVEYQRSVNR